MTRHAQLRARRLEAGTVIVNGFRDVGGAVRGVKSGFGREGGAGIEEFVRWKNIVLLTPVPFGVTRAG